MEAFLDFLAQNPGVAIVTGATITAIAGAGVNIFIHLDNHRRKKRERWVLWERQQKAVSQKTPTEETKPRNKNREEVISPPLKQS